MVSHYLDLRVVPDPETGAPQLMGALYDRLHLALVQRQLDRIGVSFPGYSTNPRGIGNVLRLHGSEQDLLDFRQSDWLKGLRNHIHFSEISPTPEHAVWRTVYRKQFKTNADRMRRRRMRRHGESAEEAREAIPISVERRPDLPYLHLRSHSTGQAYCLFIALGPPQTDARPGLFSRHGLSTEASVPCF